MADAIEDRKRIAGYLAENGPTHGDRLADGLGMTLDKFWPLINCPWFDIMTGGWGLTEKGRLEALLDPRDVQHPGKA